jgi:hypothetical protein
MLSIGPITAAAGFNVWTVFALPNTGNMGSNPIQRKDVSVRLFCIYVVLCVGGGLAKGKAAKIQQSTAEL